MVSFNQEFGFIAGPFENYIAEHEPDIQKYAVTPPYLEETSRRAMSLRSYILFGFRGSGKSATRITCAKNIWRAQGEKQKVPLIVALTDFDPIAGVRSIDAIDLEHVVRHVAFLTIESILLWISDQEEEENFTELLSDEEMEEFVQALHVFYLSHPEEKRRISSGQAMMLLHQTWVNRNAWWVRRNWTKISSIISKVISGAAAKYTGASDASGELHGLLAKGAGYGGAVIVLSKMVEIARMFGFSGLCVFVDKVDEHTKTQSSAENSVKIIYPILSQVQLMEVDGFAWIFFLWDKTHTHLTSDKYPARLDRLAHGSILWDADFLIRMVNSRVVHFSEGRVRGLSNIFASSVNFDEELRGMISFVQQSPRELIRLLDVVAREYDEKFAKEPRRGPVPSEIIETAKDRYVSDVIFGTYDKKILSQLIRLNKTTFINRDVQAEFKIGDQGARAKIKSWEDSGAVRQSGSRESEAGGKPAYEYTILDERIIRMMEKHLYDPKVLTETLIVGDDQG